MCVFSFLFKLIFLFVPKYAVKINFTCTYYSNQFKRMLYFSIKKRKSKLFFIQLINYSKKIVIVIVGCIPNVSDNVNPDIPLCKNAENAQIEVAESREFYEWLK